MSEEEEASLPSSSNFARLGRATLNVGSGLPGIGGFLAAIAGEWSERDQENVHRFIEQWFRRLEDQMREQARTIAEVIARIDMDDERIRDRVESKEYHKILDRAFRNWSDIDSEDKRVKVRNLLANAAADSVCEDDVVKLFLDWIDEYSLFHFQVIAEIYKNRYVTRGQIWRNLGRPVVREDSAEADLYKLLIRDLSTGGVIRQERETDHYGNFLNKSRSKPSQLRGSGIAKSAFDDDDQYVLTDLGQQFVHYTMNELAPRIEFKAESANGA